MTDPILGPTEVWDMDCLREIEAELFPSRPLPRPFRCRTGAVPGTKGTSKKVLSFYLKPEKTADGIGQFYVSPLVGDTEDAIHLLAKLACEAFYPNAPKMQAWFGRAYLGIEWTTRTPVPVDTDNPCLARFIPEIIQNLGLRPHGAALSPEVVREPKTTALLRAACPYCDVPVRATLSALQAAWPICAGAGARRQPHNPVYLVATSKADGLIRADAHFGTRHDTHGNPCP